jgi:RNA polymerase sigma-70 factor (ECF subfamily)
VLSILMQKPPPAGVASRPRLALVQPIPLADASDADLARAAAKGHPGAPTVVWDRFSTLVRGILRRSLGRDDVDDHVQEVFLRFFRQISTLRDPDVLRSFLIGIAIRVAKGELRRRRVRRWFRLTDDGSVPEDAPAAAEDPEAREALARLYAILDRIEDQARLAFVLRHVEGLELVDVADALGVSLATAKRRLARASSRVLAAAARDPLLVEYAPSRASENESDNGEMDADAKAGGLE